MNWLWLLIFLDLLAKKSLAMYSKRQGPDRSWDDASKRFRANLDDLFLSNEISATRAQTLYSDGAACGHKWKKRAKVGKWGKSTKHTHRDLLRVMTSRSKWPDLYLAPVRVQCPKTGGVKTIMLPFLLPHELIYSIGLFSAVEALFKQEGLCQASLSHLMRAIAELGHSLIPLGMWGDGTPCNFDRSQSIETFSMNFPGQTGPEANIRICMTAINKKFMMKNVTCDDIMAVLAWSFKVLATGTMPSVNHLGQPLTGKRAKLDGKALVRAVLVELRSDWMWLKSTFRFPQHNEKAGICWQCPCTPLDIRACSDDAEWKQIRWTHMDMAQRMWQKGHSLSPIFSAPLFTSAQILVDWLHCADLGVTADFLASLLLLVCTKLQLGSKALKVGHLWTRLQAYYRDEAVDSRLDMLKPSMLQQPKKSPKLRAKAAECRNMVGFGLQMAREYLSNDVPEEQAARVAMEHLHSCYCMLSPAVFNPDTMKHHSQLFCLQYVALEMFLPKLFHIKPKLHLFQELTQMSRSCPSLFWTYRDEEFGGTVAKVGRRRGGSNNPTATALCLLNKFRAGNELPFFM